MISFSSFDKSGASLGMRALRRGLIIVLVVFGLIKWVVYGSIVRYFLLKAEREGRKYYLDQMPVGKAD